MHKSTNAFLNKPLAARDLMDEGTETIAPAIFRLHNLPHYDLTALPLNVHATPEMVADV